MVVGTHDMKFARDVADTIVFMERSCIREVAAPEDFFTAPRSDRAKRFILRS